MLNSCGRLVLAVVIATVASSLGCATAPQEVDLPPQTLTDAPTSTAEQEAALVSSGRNDHAAVDEEFLDDGELAEKPAAPEEETAAPERFADRKHTIVIQSGGTDHVASPRSLQQASESERERRETATDPVVVITNKNLAELAEGGQITILGPDGRPMPAAAPAGQGPGTTVATAATARTTASAAPSSTTAAAAPATSTAAAAGAPSTAATAPAAANAPSAAVTEEYWRGQALKIRLDWKTAVEEVDLLQGEVADLRRRFYQEDDPFYRDNEIKPSWDRALDRLEDAKATAAAQERKLDRFLDAGRQAGALPGWLREGVEFEPPATPDNSPEQRRRTDDPWEPRVLEEEPRDP